MCGEPRAMRVGKSAESSTIQLGEEDYLVAVRRLGRGGEPLVDGGGTTARLLEERTLLEELWRISHFGWMPEEVIGRALTLAGGRSFRPAACVRVCGGCWTAAGSNTRPARTLPGNSTGG